MEIKSDEGTTFYYDLGRPTLTCYVNGKEELEGNYTYAWSAIDNNNRFRNINETFKENNDYFEALNQYNELKAQIDNNEVLLTSAQAQLKLYQDVLDQYDYVMRVEGNKIHKLKISEITKFTTYRCSVFKEGTLIGTTSIIISNNLKNESNYSVVINNGNQIFKYNEQGIAPDNKSLDNPITILPLTFTVYDNEGREVSANAIGLENVRWIVPTDKTLINSSKIDNCIEEKEKENIYLGLTELNFGIARNYSINNDNNTIKLSINYKDNITLTAQTNFTFTKTGEVGTNGTDFVCKIVPNTNDEIVPKYPTIIYNERLNTYKLNYNAINLDKWFKVQLWHDGEQVFEGTETGISSENIEVTVTWSILKNEYSRSEKDNSNLSIGSKNGVISVDNTKYERPANIVKCSIKYDGVEYYATLPVIFSRIKNEDYEILLLDNSGFNRVMYTADGQSPSYDNTSPFELIINQTITGVKENISLYEPENYRVDYEWSVKGSIGNSEKDLIQNLTEKTMLNKKRNQIYFKVADTYDGFCVNNAVQCTITQKKEEIGSIHIPIHFFLNRYGNSAMNGWDGNSISFDNEGGVILAPQVGAGTKNDDNSFTGVFMGTVKETDMSASEHGLFGYNHGERTISLNAEDGSARFGKAGLGQIVIDPTSKEAIIRSGVYDEKTGVGMEINLTKPSIKFASGKFEVAEDGTVTAEAFATKQSVQELEESVSLFNVNFDFDSIIIPCDSNNIPLENGGYEVYFSATYKNNPITSGYNVKLTSKDYEGITTMLSDNAITFTVSTEEVIKKTTNVYSLEFTYTDFSTFKSYTVNKNITVALAMQGKDGYQGGDGKSAYQIWLDAGNTGTEADYLASLQGAPGQDGKKGEDGAAGKSAYQVWLDAGNTGTEEQYLASLKGQDGEPGKDGEQGPQGEPGKDGEKGEDGNSITAIKEQYYLSTSNQNLQGGSWSDTQALPTEAKPYLWMRTVSTLSNGTTTESTPTLAVALNEMKLSTDAANALAQDALINVEGAIDKATSAEAAANKASSDASSALSKANEATSGLASLSSIVTQNYEELQGQIDGAISTWFYGYDPNTANTLPTSAWTTEALKNQHLGDLFYIIDDKEKAGQCFRYAKVNNVYKWVLVEDAEVTKAIATATQAQATADGKATIYTTSSTPIGAQEGDLWIKSKNDGILTYVNGKWEEYNKYTDNTVANQADLKATLLSGDPANYSQLNDSTASH